jgi:hypothetical protein
VAILTTVTLASTSNALPDGVTAPKHVAAVLCQFNVNFKIVFKAVHRLVKKKKTSTGIVI